MRKGRSGEQSSADRVSVPIPTTRHDAEKESDASEHKATDRDQYALSKKALWCWRLTNTSPIITAGATVGILAVTSVYAVFAYRQWRTMHDQFVATQRAAIYLGLPDGSTGELTQTGVFALHFRNYGPSPAENVIVEVWPAVIPCNHPQALYERKLEIPAFRGFASVASPSVGFPVPPGFPFTVRKKIESKDWQMVKAGGAELQVLIRISYTDQFRSDCHALKVAYSLELGKFTLVPRPSTDYCRGKPQIARFLELPRN
jgi:hypothetical protein